MGLKRQIAVFIFKLKLSKSKRLFVPDKVFYFVILMSQKWGRSRRTGDRNLKFFNNSIDFISTRDNFLQTNKNTVISQNIVYRLFTKSIFYIGLIFEMV
jgi:hypothetical protein